MSSVKEFILDEMLSRLPVYCSDYVFILNTNTLLELGDKYKGRTIRRFKYIDKDKAYLAPDPIYDE